MNSKARAYLDTEFDGHLALPESLLDDLGLPDYLTPYRLAGDQQVWVPSYEGTVALVGLDLALSALIIALGTELPLGRRVLDRFAVNFDHG